MVNITIYSIHGSYGICTSPCSIFLRFSQEGALLGARSLRGQPAEDRTYGAFWSGRAGGASASLEGGEDPILGQRFIHSCLAKTYEECYVLLVSSRRCSPQPYFDFWYFGPYFACAKCNCALMCACVYKCFPWFAHFRLNSFFLQV